MGVFQGSISYSKFYVRGELPKRFRSQYMAAVRRRVFVPLSPDDDDDERSGWCVVDNLLDLELTPDKVFFDAFLVLGYRVDKWRIPRALLKAHLNEATAEYLARKGKSKLSKPERDELKFRVSRRLKKKLLPSARQHDVCWDLERGQLLFWNRSPRMMDDLAALFEKTFGLQLDSSSPYLEAKEILSTRRLESLHGLEGEALFK